MKPLIPKRGKFWAWMRKEVALTGELLEECDAYADGDTPAALEKVQPGRDLKLEAGHARMASVQHLLLKLDFSDDGLRVVSHRLHVFPALRRGVKPGCLT